MADKIIAAKLQVDTGNSNAEIKEVNKNLKEFNTSADAAGKKATDTGKAVQGAGGNFSNLKSQISSLPGPLGQAGKGVEGLSGAFKALLANPVGLVLTAIVGILTLLYKAFTNTFEGAQKVEEIFAGIKAAGQALLDNLTKVASAIKNVFTFNFKAAVQDIKDVGNAATAAYSQMAKLTSEAQKLRREQSQNDLESVDRQAKLAALKEAATDETIPIRERIALGKQLLAETEKNAKEDLALADRVAKNKIAQLELETDGANKNFVEINQIKAEQRRGEIENANEIRNVRKQVLRAEKEEDNERKEILKAEADRRKENLAKKKEHAAEEKRLLAERLKNEEAYWKAAKESREKDIASIEDYGKALATEQDRIDKAEIARLAKNENDRLQNKKKLAELDALDNPTDPQKKIDLINAQLAIELQALADGDIQKQVLAKKASDAAVKIKADEVEAKRQLAELEQQHEEAKVSAIAGGLDTLAGIAGRQTAIGKALSIASTTINTYQSAIAAFKGVVSTIPGPVGIALGAVAAAGALATGIAAVKKIIAVKVPFSGGESGGGGAPSLTAPAAPLAPTATSTSLNQESLNGINNAANPVKAYVLDYDATTNRERNERLNRAARLGG